MNFKFGFSVEGFVVFLIPMLINILYMMFPSEEKERETDTRNPVLKTIETVSRIIYITMLCIFVSNNEIDWKSPLLFAGVIFLILYYAVWIRYFAGGRKTELLEENFLFVPVPLAIFPVLYFVCAALWLDNYIAAAFVVIFGISHITVAIQKRGKK